MNVITINVGDRVNRFILGRRGENEATEIVFDVSQLIATYGEGTAQLAAKLPNSSTPYPVSVTQDGNTVTWVVTNADTQTVGNGACELFWYIDEMLAKSIVWTTVVLKDIGEVGDTPPDPYETWLETLTELAAATTANARDAAESADDAQTAQEAAEAAQSAAESAQGIAEASASAAQASESNAASSATSAASSASAASNSALAAKASEDAAAVSEANAASSAASSAASADASAASAAASHQDANRAEQAANNAGYLEIEIVDGNLIYTRTDAVDVDFVLDNNGHLLMEVI